MTDHSGQYFGRYHLREPLGEGGMAVVYKAYDTRLEREVAVKIIRSGAFPAEMMNEVLERFEREAKSLARLSHPNIVKVHDYGEYEGSPYFVLEYFPGGTLKARLGQPVAWEEVVRLLLPIARAVAYAHERGIVHRDIKPSNILITEGGEPMLSDFGIAKILERNEQSIALTGSGMAVGTPEYMAPEQWAGKTGPKSDLYSLGIVMYELITGRKPYIADTPAAVLIKQATEPLPNPSQFKPDIPDAIERVLIKALAKEPDDRYTSMAEFVLALENLLGSSITNVKATAPASLETVFTPNPPTPPSQPAISRPATPPPFKAPAPPVKKQKSSFMPVILIGGVLALCLIVGCLAVFGGSYLAQLQPVPPPSATAPAPVKSSPTAAKATPTVAKKATATAAPAVPTATAEIPLFFTEDFSGGLDQWESLFLGTGNSGDATIEVKGDRLTFDLEGKNIYAYYFYKPQTYTSVWLKLQAVNKGVNTNNISLVCHKTNNQWYEFSVGNDGLWYLFYQRSGDYSTVAEGGSNDINMGKGVNVYEMICDENKITLRINGVTLKSFTEKQYSLKKGQIGINVSSLNIVPVITEIDFLDIREP